MNAVARALDERYAPLDEDRHDRTITKGSRVTIALDNTLDAGAYRTGVVVLWSCGQGVLALDEPEPDGRDCVPFWATGVRALDDVPLSTREQALALVAMFGAML